jgi:hypothetical protein
MKKFTVLTLLLIASISSFAQTYEPEFLIPYNYNGKWGWCDTMGKILIEPQFQEVSFFDYKERQDTEIEANVKTKYGANKYNITYGLLVPENFILTGEIYNYSENDKHRLFEVKSENKKLGIFESKTKQMVVQPEWDVVEYDSDFQDLIYLKKDNEKVYYTFNRSTQKLTKTTIDSLFNTQDPEKATSHYYSPTWFFKHTNGSISKLVDGKEILLTAQQKKAVLSVTESWEVEATKTGGSWDYFDPTGKSFSTQSKMIDTTTCLIGLIQYPAKSHNAFKQYRVIRENGKIGVYDNQGILIVPFIYDKIAFQDNNEQALLYSGDKVGMKLFLKKYKTIEPKYDHIDYYQSIRVNSRWNFRIYEVTIGDKKGLMGENGVEYFHFD